MPNNAKITILGNLTRDPVSRQAGANTVVSFNVAVSTMNKGADGNYASDFYDVSVWGKNGEYLAQKIQKGTQVWVTGDFSTGEYEGKDGQKHATLRITATDVRPVSRLKGEGTPITARGADRGGYNGRAGANDMPF